ncbi:MAG: DUF169 domain-containing protein [Candidatus Hinthialibacter antarcticus]|nr:DUF169 domain-containing protein [Candidatus Hinthialibacter antarcticus]
MPQTHLQLFDLLKKQFGGEWIGVKINPSDDSKTLHTQKNLRVCEAIWNAKNESFILPVSQVSCMGGRRSLGDPNVDENALIEHIAEETGMTRISVRSILEITPRLDRVYALEMGAVSQPDVVMSYCSPRTAMKLVRLWQRMFQNELSVQISTFLATCGNVLSKSYQRNTICLSMGCPTSREMGFIQNDEIVVGIPARLINPLCLEERCDPSSNRGEPSPHFLPVQFTTPVSERKPHIPMENHYENCNRFTRHGYL